MKSTKKPLILKIIIIICLLLSQPVLSNTQSQKLPFDPTINSGIATFSGEIIGIKGGEKGFNPFKITYHSLLSGDLMIYNIPVKKDGTFSMKIPVESVVFVSVNSDFFNGLNCLVPGEETKLNISIENDQKKQIQFKNNIGFTTDDAEKVGTWPLEVPEIGLEIVSPEVYSQKKINGLQGLLKLIDNDKKLSALSKQIIASIEKFMTLFHSLLKYDSFIIDAYKAQNKTDKVPDDFHPQVPDKSYYSFLKYFNLNDPIYISTGFYPMILKEILNNEILAIPDIKEQPIDEWLMKVKAIMKDKIGTDSGIIYDLIAQYSFIKQLNYANPLSEIQKKNIKTYFKNRSFAEALFAKNGKVLKQSGSKANIHEISGASDRMMDSIITKYNGKVVFVDFWATWCGPCLKAMNESEIVRKEFENKDVVFLYVTDHSSPKKNWEQQIPEIGGEQYYVTNEQMGYLYKTFKFSAIPHYLIYDKRGTLKYNYHTFMGIENMRKWIDETLRMN